jgi:hypothetical protein
VRPFTGLDVLEKLKSLRPGREKNDFSVVLYRLSYHLVRCTNNNLVKQ